MKKLNALAVMVAMLLVPVAFAGGVSDGKQNPNHVQGEKLDSGLDEIGYYCDPEFIGNAVLGESLDSGLGELSADYTGAEFMRNVVLGEKQDSGLGELTQGEMERLAGAQAMMASSGSSSLRALKAPGVMSAGYPVPPSNEGE